MAKSWEKDVSGRVRRALKAAGAEYVRTCRHHLFRLPNGATLVLSLSGGKNAEAHQLRDIKRALAWRPPSFDSSPKDWPPAP